METIIVKPRNKEEYTLVSALMQRMNIPTSASHKKKNNAIENNSGQKILDSLQGRLN
jgi:hypothetical protein